MTAEGAVEADSRLSLRPRWARRRLGGWEVEDFGRGVVGFRLPEEVAGCEAAGAEAPAKTPKPRRKAAAA